MQKHISLSCCAPRYCVYKLSLHIKRICISNINAAVYSGNIRSGRFKIISSYTGVNTWNNNTNNN